MQVAQTILSQLGGGKFKVMTGAKDFYSIKEGRGLQFKLPSNFAKNKANTVRIILNSNDLYDVEFGRVWGLNYKVKSTHNDVYCDMLVELFENETGLYTHL
jgi:hypothetical protein